ncbi:MAG: hypothetical protein NUV74_07280, partial [Candidatus Brocadiaceae bacterium]|nr:hypothetical protein [Candidatus Brocadiaceae bacterium]
MRSGYDSAINFSEESNIEYRTRNNECRRIIEHLILKNAEEILPSELFVQRWVRKLHNSKFLVRYSYFNTRLNRPDMLEIFLTLHFRLVQVMNFKVVFVEQRGSSLYIEKVAEGPFAGSILQIEP